MSEQSVNKEYHHKVLFIDDWNLLEVHNLRRKVNQVVKHPEPVFKLDAPWNTEKMEAFNYQNVLYDAHEKLFKMWYVVISQPKDEYWERGRKTAYATSKDGVHWETPIMKMVEVNGSKENNYIIGEMLSLVYTIIDDPSDPPERRYKMMFFVDSNEARWGRFHVPLGLAYSADGINWQRPWHVNPVVRGISDGGWSFFYDRDRRKYQLYTRRVPNLPRDVSLYESFDLVNWEDRGRILVPGDELDPPEMFNFQAMTPFAYENYRLGLLNTQYSLPASEDYEVFHEPPPGYPRARLGHLDVQLTYSRDGVKWERPRDRTPIIPNGGPGSPDEGVIFLPAVAPIVLDGDTYIFYTAVRFGHNSRTMSAYLEAHDYDLRGSTTCMLATMPEDHWVSLDAGDTEGYVTAKAWHIGLKLLVNASAKGGTIAAEYLTPYGQPIKGFTRDDCIPITGDGKAQQIRWKSGASGWDLNSEHRGGVLTRFYLKNAKLYSYTVTEPDPDGAITRHWQNFRWTEVIKHRSDNWDGQSNAPARGVAASTHPHTRWT
jgi:hypothetical protein